MKITLLLFLCLLISCAPPRPNLDSKPFDLSSPYFGSKNTHFQKKIYIADLDRQLQFLSQFGKSLGTFSRTDSLNSYDLDKKLSTKTTKHQTIQKKPVEFENQIQKLEELIEEQEEDYHSLIQ